ncbi:hypothetical protein V5799_012481 [Amblyomma americanum]|uniref:Niemann-Pick C1 N-terminal domain-containing protein n=1 Tax=Amblyomma americanum TaxID=6943 RepID=A0AAQ4EE28_AMBAM
MSSQWLFALAVGIAFVSSARAQCISYGYCGTDDDSGKPLPCSVNREPVPIKKNVIEGACPALIGSSGESVPACCDVKQAEAFKSEFKTLFNLGVGKTSACFLNFQNLVCQAFCSPRQSEFFAINGTVEKGNGHPSATDSVYAVSKKFAERVYNTCKDVRTYVFGIKLMRYMCGKHGNSNCNAERLLEFVGSIWSEGGYSPIKIRHVITDSPITVGGKKLEPFSPEHLH